MALTKIEAKPRPLLSAFVAIASLWLSIMATVIGLWRSGLWRLLAFSVAVLCLVVYLNIVTSEVRRHLQTLIGR